jgi:hypothetical protein
MFLEIAPMQEAEMILGSNCCYGNSKVTYQIHHINGSAPKFSQQGCTLSVKSLYSGFVEVVYSHDFFIFFLSIASQFCI